MKQRQRWIALIAVLMLSACHDSETSTRETGVYQGIIWSDDAVPFAAQVVVQQQESLLTLWDEREHQTSYSASEDPSRVLFSAAAVSCTTSDTTLRCSSNGGDTILTAISPQEVALADFAGSYQARDSDRLLTMTIDNTGVLTLSGEGCTSDGSLTRDEAMPGVVSVTLTDSECVAAGRVNLVTLHTDNESLVSINVETSSDNFPQVWVAL